ncbi:helix-turn-helix transcriptional regulator [Rhizobium mongolense]|uniref:helix-turn-helix transcriptional regulator n=1 Tax=Rhizobium TaxID=379 RepID=UPI0024B1DD7D|nr:helix-turn-helix domain-containing protein [Rhizobium sp. CC1099]WFU88872.1 helix-turn-helix domain-containing protein [Rhizobium sp. CC1099]
MANRHKRKGKSKFVALDGYLLRSAAWRSLSAIERAAYLELKWAYDGKNNGRIGMAVRTLAEAVHVSKSTASRALIGLQERGFIVLVKQSGFNVKSRIATEWQLTEYELDDRPGTATKDFMKWTPENSNNSPARRTNSPSGGTVKATGREKHGFTVPPEGP